MKGKVGCVRNRRDLEQAARLAADSFVNHHPALTRQFAEHVCRTPGVGMEHVRAIRQGGRIVALLVIYEKTVRVGRARMKMGGLGFVCSSEAVRGKGTATACLADAVEYMRANGFHFSILFGIDRFYRRVGYVGCLPGHEIRVRVGELKDLRSKLVTRPFVLRDGRAVVRLYEQAAKDCACSTIRTEKTLRAALHRRQLFPRRSKRGNGMIVFHPPRKRQDVRAYVIWRDGELHEAGVAPGDDVALSAVLAWLRDKRREALEKEIVIPHGPDHPLVQFAMRFNHEAERGFSWTGGGMGRIIDVKAFLQALTPELEARLNRAGVDGQCHLHLTVRTAPDKTGRKRAPEATRHTIVLATGNQFMLANRPQYWLKVECSQQTLLQLVLGSLPHGALSDLSLEGERNLMPVLFPTGAPEMFRLDHF
jgi:predicted N-acetyltransferase YhbS